MGEPDTVRLLIRRSLVRAQVGEPSNTRVSRLAPADFLFLGSQLLPYCCRRGRVASRWCRKQRLNRCPSTESSPRIASPWPRVVKQSTRCFLMAPGVCDWLTGQSIFWTVPTRLPRAAISTSCTTNRATPTGRSRASASKRRTPRTTCSADDYQARRAGTRHGACPGPPGRHSRTSMNSVERSVRHPAAEAIAAVPSCVMGHAVRWSRRSRLPMRA